MLFEKLKSIQKDFDVNIYSVKSGLSSSGIDLGSTYVSPIKNQKGGGTSKTCLPAAKIRSMSKEKRDELVAV